MFRVITPASPKYSLEHHQYRSPRPDHATTSGPQPYPDNNAFLSSWLHLMDTAPSQTPNRMEIGFDNGTRKQQMACKIQADVEREF